MADETYDAATVRSLAVQVDGAWEITALVLKDGETAWNPASTKGPLHGPALVEYEMHPTSIRVIEEDLTDRCMGGEVGDGGGWERCSFPRVGTKTRCIEHSLENLAAHS